MTIPPHGTPARYYGTPRTGNRPPCKCRKCVDAHTKACAARELQHLAGIPLRVPSTPIADHVRLLLDAGMSRNGIARAAGVSSAAVSHLARGTNPTTNRTIADKILAVHDPRITSDTELTNPTGAQRRLRALYVKGHGPVAISSASGQSDTTITRTVSSTPTRITIATHNAFCLAYRNLAHHDGHSTKARKRALREGWPGPDFWDDIDHIDDPAFDPAVVLTDTPRYLRLGEDALWLRDQGYTREQIAHRLGESVDYIDQSIKRYRKTLGSKAAAGATNSGAAA